MQGGQGREGGREGEALRFFLRFQRKSCENIGRGKRGGDWRERRRGLQNEREWEGNRSDQRTDLSPDADGDKFFGGRANAKGDVSFRSTLLRSRLFFDDRIVQMGISLPHRRHIQFMTIPRWKQPMARDAGRVDGTWFILSDLPPLLPLFLSLRLSLCLSVCPSVRPSVPHPYFRQLLGVVV